MANITNVGLNALQKVQNTAAGGAAPASGGPSFGDVLKQSIQSAIDAQHTSEKVSAASLVGKADITQVLQAVNNAELALNTVLAVRDRVVQAYENIMRTNI
ncbi:MAG: flagellar hook-basal body complex protein FliE [Alphaproteobacteria bacterium]|nr:MAG: flagellar hook-basal body complex protein FliE [Alphaproteobacteria bacterium]